MAKTRYLVLEMLADAQRFGQPTISPLPKNWSVSTWGWPDDFVMDGTTRIWMTRVKFDELTAERIAYAEELRRNQLASARVSVKEIEAQVKDLQVTLDTRFEELNAAKRADDLSAVMRLCHQVNDAARSLASTRGALGEQRFTIQELSDHAKTKHEVGV
jgi:hypothetical protein